MRNQVSPPPCTDVDIWPIDFARWLCSTATIHIWLHVSERHHTAFAFACRPPALFYLPLVYCTMSTLKQPTICQRISSKFQLKPSASGNTSNNEPTRDCQSPAINNARMIFQLASNLGSRGLNVPGLQAAGLISVQIINAIKVSIIYFSFSVIFWSKFNPQKFKSNKQDVEDLVIHISKLMEPILNALQNKTMQDIDPNLAADLLHFQK